MHVPAMQVADGDASDSDASGVGKWFFLGALKHLKFSKSALRAACYAGGGATRQYWCALRARHHQSALRAR